MRIFLLLFLSSFLHSKISHPPHPKKGAFPFDKQGNYREEWADSLDGENLEEMPPTSQETPLLPKPRSEWSKVRTYTVKRGDSLYIIGKRFNTTVNEIQKMNGVSGSLIYPNQKLLIPKTRK